MLTDLQALFSATLGIFQTEFSLYGISLSFWSVFLWSLVAGLLIWFIWRIFHD